ncbi:Hypothetical_protein [Hexamita inflata]|uniref:Hypothetical_protein n=1 Tax=Hexamita inflata TaxID=28002 RepID=A0AA86TY93_9EUKA|nr:Hypothetical protein HINF_LOCUS19232 [Hexamita inflata]
MQNMINVMFISAIRYGQLMQKSDNNVCNKNLLFDNQQFEYCEKSKHLNTIEIDNNLVLSQQSSHIFIYTHGALDSQINAQVSFVKIFAVFGFNIEHQAIQDCNINISIDFQVVKAALICLECDLLIDSSNLTFIAVGNELSGVIYQSKKSLQIENSIIQNRFYSNKSAGLINTINSSLESFSVSKSKISYFNLLSSEFSGYFVAEILNQVQLSVQNVIVCVQSITNTTGKSDIVLQQIGSEQLACANFCKGSEYIVYGLCLDELVRGTITFSNQSQECVYPLQYDQNSCVCAEGYILNATFCFGLINRLTTLDIDIISNYTFMDLKLNQYMQGVERNIVLNYSLSDKNLAQNTTNVDSGLNANISAFNASMQILTDQEAQNNIDLINSQLDNASYVETQLVNNASYTDAYLTQSVVDLNTAFSRSKLYLETQLQNNISRFMSNLNANSSNVDSKFFNNMASLTSTFTSLDSKVTTNQNNLNAASTQQQAYLEQQLINNYTAQTNNLNSLLTGLRNDLTVMNSTQNGLVNGMRTDLNTFNANDNNAINGQTANVNNAHSRIDGNINEVNLLKGIDNNLQYQINVLNSKNVQSVTFQNRNLPIGYYGAMVSVLFVCVDSDCRQVG